MNYSTIADAEGYTGEYRLQWIKHCILLDNAVGDEWYKEANWFLERNLSHLLS